MSCIKLSPLISAIIIYALIVILGGVPSAYAQATYDFNAITCNNSGDVSIAENQLYVDVFERSGLAVFRFYNVGPEDCSITRIYFDDSTGLLNSFARPGPTSSDPGVSFSIGPSPSELPAGRSIIPELLADYAVGSNAPVQPNGINPGEELFVPFNYAGDISSIERAIYYNQLRIGLHVQGFECGGSESVEVVPEPCSMLMSGIGLGIAGILKRRKII